MPKTSRADIEAQIEALQNQLAADDGRELVVEDEKGRKTTLRGADARRWLTRLGLDDDDDQGDDDDGEEQDPPPPKNKLRARFFESS